jgi:hypothetical protein
VKEQDLIPFQFNNQTQKKAAEAKSHHDTKYIPGLSSRM